MRSSQGRPRVRQRLPPFSTMLNVQQKAQCVIWYAESKSPVSVQRLFQRTYPGQTVPDYKAIIRWFNQFKETGTVEKKSRPGRPPTSEENIERIRQSCLRSPKKSIARRSVELQIPKTTIQNVLHKRLRLHAYKIQIRQQIKPTDRPMRAEFASFMLNGIDDNPNFLQRVLFTDEATFHINGSVNRYNCRIWGSQQPNEIQEYVRDSPKLNVWCGLFHDQVIGPFFFVEKTITGLVYLDMLELFVLPQIEQIEQQTGQRIIFMQDGAPPHYLREVRGALNACFPNGWIGRGAPIAWPPRSPDLTPLDFFLWGYIKNIVYAEKIRDLDHLRERISAAILTVTPEMIARTWQEIDYRLDICRATNGAHIETY